MMQVDDREESAVVGRHAKLFVDGSPPDAQNLCQGQGFDTVVAYR
jgi:hypothetical protein